ncbi:hypothetical protein [Stigmatella aurantiaca]|uniref:SnoaL-like domain-containing protein n=1 Tax=Stigmatella aurantiaca (strain DW4/3-1) TaxID=378806 RepID=Q09AE5_STIAD|nr:hypothetical protein [Stigmatella aurantiaca]ADO67991.1 uncharacterized protein STAUR_0182 [Stigmatella aurantiaca DW4/3-1]EAU68742.1 hypothetical protein STIAU_2822 [Stigmatella aurantiaca DW4/3-1]
MSQKDQALIHRLEERFRRVTEVLYDTSVPADVLDEEVLPYLAEDIVFTDPWQRGAGIEDYRLGAVGFHLMFSFDFEVYQLNVQLEENQKKGRAIVDGVMNLKQFSWLYTYPLRTILVYDFTLDAPAKGGRPQPRIHAHEEMWSFGDMIAAVPVAGWFYKNIFRKGFSHGFLAASALSRKLSEARSHRNAT